jgi:ABC-2 type transport system ATP-binding protein
MGENPIICIENLSKWYKGSSKPAIRNLSLELPEGRISGLLGPNGAGKTTMIRILCSLLKPTEGNITIGGFSLKNETAKLSAS